MNKTISILGCGWLGLPLAKVLVAAGWQVKGSTTNQEKLNVLIENKIIPYQIKLNPKPTEPKDFFDSECLFINVPPRLKSNPEDFHLEQITGVLENVNPSITKNIIFISSTSVYPDANKIMTEEDADSEHVLYKAESLLINYCKNKNLKYNILRCSGLMGYDRIPCKYYAGKKNLEIGETPVNYVHLDDLLAIIVILLNGNDWNEILNIAAPLHPNRKEVFEKCAEETGYEKATFIIPANKIAYKIIDTNKLSKFIDYQFIYPNPLDFKYNNKLM